MAAPTEFAKRQSDSFDGPTLNVDFQWRKYHALVTEAGQSSPSYDIDMKKLRAPHIIFKDVANNETIATGTLHYVHIDADYELRGRKGTLKALKKFETSYTHLSHTYSNSTTPEAMTWTSGCGFKTWDFTCLNEQQEPVARFSANSWALKKMGKIQFMGPKANDKAFQEEMLVVGMTLFLCMVVRATSILSFFGAIFASTGPLDKHAASGSRASAPRKLSGSASEDEVEIEKAEMRARAEEERAYNAAAFTTQKY